MQAGPLMLDLEGYTLSSQEEKLIQHPQVGGVILFSRNFQNRTQIKALADHIRSHRPELLLAVDQEGGRVQRFKEGYTRLPAMASLGEYYKKNLESGASLLANVGWLMAVEILASGLDFSFAPVLDVDKKRCNVIANRAFADDPEFAAICAGHFIEGMHDAGMAVTGKHFPGHGGVLGDSHLETPFDNRSLEDLEKRDLIPFRRLAPLLDAVMPAHIVFPEMDNQCVGFSSYWLQTLLRGNMDFDGVIFSDDLSMKGADHAGGYAQKAALALDAGCDMVLVCNNRAGAEDVLDYLVSRDMRPSPRLVTMKAQKQWLWSALENSPRRLSTIKHIEQII